MPAPLRVVLLTQYFPPETGAPQRRWGDLTRRLAARGHQVKVVTAMPNYPAGVVLPAWRGRASSREHEGDVDVLRSWLYTSPHRGTAGQLAVYGSFAASAALTAPFRLRSADVLLWESPPLFLSPAASILRLRLGAALVMNVSDLWPRSAYELGLVTDRRLLAVFERWERAAYRAADLVTHQTDGIGAGVEARAPGTPRLLFPNGVDAEVFRRAPASAAWRHRLGVADDHRLIVGYAGNFGRAQALEQVIEAAAIVEATGAAISFVLIGGGPRRNELVARARALGLQHLHITASVPAAEMPELLSQFDVGIVPLADKAVFEGARPSKLFELLAVGIPVVYCGRGEGARLAEESGAATIVPPEDPAALVVALRALVAAGPGGRVDAGTRGRAYVRERFDRAAIAATVEQGLLDVVARRRLRSRSGR